MNSLLFNYKKRSLLFLVISSVSLGISFFNIGNPPIDTAWVAIVLCGIPIIYGAGIGLITKLDIKTDILVSLALIAAVVIGETFAAGEVAFIMTIGTFLEEHTVAKAHAGIEKLVHLKPATARVVHDKEELVIPAEQVQLDDMLRVLAGETIAVDGKIVSGHTSIDQSVITGESLPVDKTIGDEVKSGTVNRFGTFDMVAKQVGEDTTLQRMIRLVESADAGKAKIVRIADKWATWIVLIALASATLTWLISGEIIRAVTILVVFCPCALVLATPTAIMAGIGNVSKLGILVRKGDALERLAEVKRVAFDKTGTLTYGFPSVTKIECHVPEYDVGKLLHLVASAELRSEHPLGKTLVSHLKKNSACILPEPDEFELIPGQGVCAAVEGKEIHAGNKALFAVKNISLPDTLVAAAAEAENSGCSVIYVAAQRQALGLVALSDTLRPNAADIISAIHQTGSRTVLLTGDSSQAAMYIARLAGITEVKADCLPEDKLAAIAFYQTRGEPVCMVGDGINDAPALKAAHVGIAMGGIGSDIAIDAADIVLVSDDIMGIPHLLQLAKKTMKTIHFNLAMAMLLNFIAIILAMLGILNPVVGALVHNASSVAVILNSSLLLQWKNNKVLAGKLNDG